jgi:SAM-dependent methyltransferase
MIPADVDYIWRLTAAKIIDGPVLELGAGYGGETSRQVIESAALKYYGTDLTPGSGVDFAADFERAEDMRIFRSVAPFGTVLILNVLEHTFDPIRILDNALTLIRPGGHLVVLTPAIWSLHNYPMDAWRILPNFYEEYAKRRELHLINDHFEYVGFGPVQEFKNSDGTYRFPPPCDSPVRTLASRVIHKAFNTFGRSMFYPNHISVVASFRVEGAAHA